MRITTEKAIKRFKDIHGDRYDYSLVEYKNNRTSVDIICRVHGKFTQNPASHWAGFGCKLCNGKIYNKEQFLNKAREVHGNRYDYSKVNYINAVTEVSIICSRHGEFKQTPTAHYNNSGCLKCANNILSLDEFIQKSKSIHGNIYDYSQVEEFDYMSDKVKIVCKDHGVFEQRASRHISGQRCCKCATEINANNMRYDLNAVLSMFKDVHGDRYDYKHITSYTSMRDVVKIVCKDHGVFEQQIHNHIKFQGCPKCSIAGPSQNEYTIKEFLKSNNIKHIHSDRSVLKPKELDFYLYDDYVAIECNGAYWHSSKFIDKNYHLNKTIECNIKDIQLLHFWDFEINNKFDIVSSMILSKTNNISNKIYARKCNIIELNSIESNKFLENNHLQGKCNSSIRLGLQYDGEIVAILTFGKSRFNNNHEWELIRFCNKINTTVIGGASKLFKHFINYFYEGGSIISYANIRYSDGKLYNNLNFIEMGRSKPSYYYKGSTIISRYQAQKHKLSKLLGENNFDINLTEEQNMNNNGYYRVYDCGNIVYVYNDV